MSPCSRNPVSAFFYGRASDGAAVRPMRLFDISRRLYVHKRCVHIEALYQCGAQSINVYAAFMLKLCSNAPQNR